MLDPLVPLVEFRHRSWLEEDERADTLAFLERHGLAYVSVDAPPTRASNVLPPVAAATHRVAYVRFHGRNVKTWNIKAEKSSERFNWMYSAEELAEWVEKLGRLTEDADEVYALFNNNRDDFAPAERASPPRPAGRGRSPRGRRSRAASARADAVLASEGLGGRVELDVSVLAETHSLENRVEPLRAVGRRKQLERAGLARRHALGAELGEPSLEADVVQVLGRDREPDPRHSAEPASPHRSVRRALRPQAARAVVLLERGDQLVPGHAHASRTMADPADGTAPFIYSAWHCDA